MSRDVIFADSSNSAPSDHLIETDFDIDPNKENQLRLTSEESLVSARLGGPKEPPM